MTDYTAMTDDELSRAVALLEGFVSNGVVWFRVGEQAEYDQPPSYATDWWRAGALVEKYGPTDWRHELDLLGMGRSSLFLGLVFRYLADGEPYCRAICLAVLALHEQERE